ncbi:MAG: helix-turn-helix domain-containing protein [Paraclostridium sordellii]|uniref:helix-turn-helix domain-containing protein n=1 Tax=Paraclostridium sordellii TaxID=1505 RepID=UPI0005E4A7F0|nr:helix-turn-helix transcriptional regulator [Paeniclostridium sordellii]MCH1965675.1 helix-turn-helix domain-containing protein [Paeniclostridium sordellii]MDU4412776.1 helix-turn-helix transcriptional regulator [Paeniclostridium sordellii]CEN23765.1 DNA-binding protein [[Clostridium] sordellii] [Paeniclostridium sordellii]CEN83357.1 DNA-binding protein [[Clostridium] sordellii] [Paeniclostridium sordellii]CEQ06492.1 DNA-binding protein [[Clostridium] sordellii] [Paeniclostridium sordellii]
MEIGKQVKKYRTEMKLSQDELAEKIFVSRQTISNWENNKNYPDVKSLLLLSSLFNVSLDILIKGDLEEMKKEIKTEDIEKFKHDGNIFSILLITTMVSAVPLNKFMGNAGFVIWIIIAIASMYYAIKVEKHKKDNNVQTYREILTFIDGKNMDEVQKHQEYGKRPYQKWAIVIGVALLTIVISIIMAYILF